MKFVLECGAPMKDLEILLKLTNILMELLPMLTIEEALNLAYIILEETLRVDHYEQ